MSHNVRTLLLVLALALPLAGCGETPDDDDTTDDDDITDDDDSTPPPDPLAPVIGIFNLTNVVQSEGQSYVDFSGAFGSFVDFADDTLSPAAYLATFSYGADAPYWRLDLGAFPLPPLGSADFVDMLIYYPWVPSEQVWWDGGARIGAGNYLSSRLDLEDVTAYQVDDPVHPGAAGWVPGGSLRWENDGGDPVVAWAEDDVLPLPQAMVMTSPEPGALVNTPAALDFTVEWSPAGDDSFVTVGLVNDYGYAYIAHVPDTGSHSIPATVLHDDFGSGEVDLVVARNLETQLPHPQGAILFRSREEQRAVLKLQPDIVLEPGYAQPGETLNLSLGWFTADLSGGVTVDLGPGINVLSVQSDPSDLHRATLTIQVAPGLSPGGRDVTLTLPNGVQEVLAGGFAILNLAPLGTCAESQAQLPLTEGSWVSTTAGLSNDFSTGFSCVPWSLNGSDAVYRVLLEAGETLIASVIQSDDSDPALVLLSDCGNTESSVACADSGYTGDSETLVYTAQAAGTYYLVIDSWVGGGFVAPSSAFELEISIARDVIRPDWIVPGTTRNFTLIGEVPWAPGLLPADIDLGPGMGIDALAAGSLPTELDLLASANSAAPVGPRDISVDNGSAGTVNFSEAFWVTGWPSWNSCAEAQAAAGLGAGSAIGYGVQTSSTIDEIPCMPYASTGPEVILPFDLNAGQTFTASVTSEDDSQLYILSDCNLPESCFEDAAVDETLGFEEEIISGWTVPATGRYFLVVDLWGSVDDPLTPWILDLTVSLQ